MFQLKQVACAYEQKKVFTGLDLEIRQGQYAVSYTHLDVYKRQVP